ncbi:hypothetical protein [Bosea sp. NBC_00550]|uniref:hypothetical protein n=1 Tax=Bosea sp. NBC_00550 TaxID=2969621 RepID=UPI00223248E4|nr:hypothetical protein [Bosea sp. NBC_00550]UZF93026.1 hypothetical protein NWE53_02070 [Bosea sp. NBC_00550]
MDPFISQLLFWLVGVPAVVAFLIPPFAWFCVALAWLLAVGILGGSGSIFVAVPVVFGAGVGHMIRAYLFPN